MTIDLIMNYSSLIANSKIAYFCFQDYCTTIGVNIGEKKQNLWFWWTNTTELTSKIWGNPSSRTSSNFSTVFTLVSSKDQEKNTEPRLWWWELLLSNTQTFSAQRTILWTSAFAQKHNPFSGLPLKKSKKSFDSSFIKESRSSLRKILTINSICSRTGLTAIGSRIEKCITRGPSTPALNKF